MYCTVQYCKIAYISFGCIYCNFLVSWVVAFLEPGQFTFKLIWAGWAYTLTALQSLISQPNHPLPFLALSPCVIQSFLFILYNHNLCSLSVTYTITHIPSSLLYTNTHHSFPLYLIQPFLLYCKLYKRNLSSLSYSTNVQPFFLIWDKHNPPYIIQPQPFLLILFFLTWDKHNPSSSLPTSAPPTPTNKLSIPTKNLRSLQFISQL